MIAFVNSGGQLIVSGADGGFRWIITNPGETLAGGFSWSVDGDRLFFAVSNGAQNSLRMAQVSSQAVTEVGVVSGNLVAVSPDGIFAFLQQSDGSYSLQALNSTAAPLPISNDRAARYSGLWSNILPLVAYWGYVGNSNLAVTDAVSAQTALLDSGRSAPITPLAWLPGNPYLIFRDASGVIRLADVSCLQSGCSSNPLESAVALASADADIATDGTWLFFRSGDALAAVNLSCANSDSCLNSAVGIAVNAAPLTAISAAVGRLVYTAYQQNPNDPNDREVRVIDLSCLNSGACAPQAAASGAVAGALSSDGRYAVVEVAGGLSTLDLNSGAQAYLSDSGAPLIGAVWQP